MTDQTSGRTPWSSRGISVWSRVWSLSGLPGPHGPAGASPSLALAPDVEGRDVPDPVRPTPGVHRTRAWAKEERARAARAGRPGPCPMCVCPEHAVPAYRPRESCDAARAIRRPRRGEHVAFVAQFAESRRAMRGGRSRGRLGLRLKATRVVACPGSWRRRIGRTRRRSWRCRAAASDTDRSIAPGTRRRGVRRPPSSSGL
jgi:hypothetical protein